MFYNPTEDSLIDPEILKSICDNEFSNPTSITEVRKVLPDVKNESDTKHIMIGANKGGVGKTTIAVQLAWFLNLKGYNVLLVDFDAQSNVTCALMDDDNKVEGEYSFYDLVRGECMLDDLIGSVSEGLDVLSGNHNLSEFDHHLRKAEEDAIEKSKQFDFYGDHRDKANKNEVYLTIYKLLRKIGESYDFVIYDTSPEVNRFNRLSMQVCDLAIVPIQPKQTSLKSFMVVAAEIHSSFETINRNIEGLQKRIRVVVNCLHEIKEKKKDALIKKLYMHYSDFITSSFVEFCEEMGEASDIGWPLYIHKDVTLEQISNFNDFVEEILDSYVRDEAAERSTKKQNSRRRKPMFMMSEV